MYFAMAGLQQPFLGQWDCENLPIVITKIG